MIFDSEKAQAFVSQTFSISRYSLVICSLKRNRNLHGRKRTTRAKRFILNVCPECLWHLFLPQDIAIILMFAFKSFAWSRARVKRYLEDPEYNLAQNAFEFLWTQAASRSARFDWMTQFPM